MTDTAFVAWDDEFATGVKKIDDQHKLLLAMINRVHALSTDSAAGGSGTSEILAVLDELNRYANYHFRTEEFLMGQHLEPGDTTAQHVMAHHAYWPTLNAFEKQLQEGEAPTVINDLADYLKKWWVNHILVVDRKTGKALNEAGVY